MPDDTCQYYGPERRAECLHADAAAEKAVKKTFAILGVDVDRPEQVREFQDSLRFSDKLRRMVEGSTVKLFLVVASLIGAAFITGLKYSGK